MSEPEKVIAGDTVSWTIPQGEYSAATWTLTYSLVKPDGEKIEITGSADSSNDHLVSIAASVSAAWQAGVYYWQRYVTNGSDRHTTGEGRIEVKPNLAVAAVDMRSDAQRAFEALSAVRENKATQDQLSYSIQGRSISRMSWDEVNAAWSHFKTIVDNEIATERSALGSSVESNTVKVSFENA